jgi:hypothetical protein
MNGMAAIISITLLAFILNLPFGYLRSRARRYSAAWFIYLHLTVPLLIAARVLTHTDYQYVPLFIAAAAAGQFLGGRIRVNG